VEVFAIRSDADLDRALGAIAALLDARNPSDEERDRLLVLTTLVEAYEDAHHPIPPPRATEAIRFRLEQQGLVTPAQQARALRPIIGSRSRVYEVLHGRRALSAQMVLKLWRTLGIPLESLIGGMSLRKKARSSQTDARRAAPKKRARAVEVGLPPD
jgi:HTH-type transcriptional regulator/antitoxin HigA